MQPIDRGSNRRRDRRHFCFEADVYGKIGTEFRVKQLLTVRASGRVEGKWIYGEIEVEKGGVLAGMAESTEFRSERKGEKKRRSRANPSESPS